MLRIFGQDQNGVHVGAFAYVSTQQGTTCTNADEFYRLQPGDDIEIRIASNQAGAIVTASHVTTSAAKFY